MSKGQVLHFSSEKLTNSCLNNIKKCYNIQKCFKTVVSNISNFARVVLIN